MDHLKIEKKWHEFRFIDQGDGTVKDNITELVWLKNANCFGKNDWNAAMEAAYSLADGKCGLIDGSKAGDWRLPKLKELKSLGDRIRSSLSFHPFIDLKLNYYWSSDEYIDDDTRDKVWCVRMGPSGCSVGSKTALSYVWPARY